MELRHLRYFVAIAEERSFTRAAERLLVAQPGLSTQMRRLETELGLRLFERHPRGVDLTAAGTLFLERARLALAATDAAGATGRDMISGVVGMVRLGVASEARWHRTPAVLDRFARERAGVELTMIEGYGGTLWRDLRDGHLDAVAASAGSASADLRALGLGAEPWVVLIGKGHRLAGIGPLSARDLAGERVVVTGHRDGAAYDRAVADLLDDLEVPARLVRGGVGPAMHRPVAEGDAVVLTTAPAAIPAGVVMRPLDPERRLPFVLVWRDETPSPGLAEFVRIAAESMRSAPVRRRVLAAAA
jgi:DNA-binding transcriptional LysR family regulator